MGNSELFQIVYKENAVPTTLTFLKKEQSKGRSLLSSLYLICSLKRKEVFYGDVYDIFRGYTFINLYFGLAFFSYWFSKI